MSKLKEWLRNFMLWLAGPKGILTLPLRLIVPLFVLTLLYKNKGKWIWGDLKIGHSGDQSLFYNGVFCIRFMLPFFIGIGIRWAAKNPSAREFLHFAMGWKLNGEFTIEFRIQSDLSSAAGATSPNYGQAIGWNKGPK